MTVAELKALLAQLPDDAVLHVEGDEFVPPRLYAMLRGNGPAVCILDPNHQMVDHSDGRILW